MKKAKTLVAMLLATVMVFGGTAPYTISALQPPRAVYINGAEGIVQFFHLANSRDEDFRRLYESMIHCGLMSDVGRYIYYRIPSGVSYICSAERVLMTIEPLTFPVPVGGELGTVRFSEFSPNFLEMVYHIDGNVYVFHLRSEQRSGVEDLEIVYANEDDNIVIYRLAPQGYTAEYLIHKNSNEIFAGFWQRNDEISVSGGLALFDFKTLEEILFAPSSWAEAYVNAAFKVGFVPFSLRYLYTQPISRVEFSTIAVALYEYFNDPIQGRVSFTDTTDINAEKAAYLGIVITDGYGRFQPYIPLTREQAAVMLARLSEALGHPLTPSASTLFDDMDDISSWALDALLKMMGEQIMVGVGGNRIAPHQPYTREQSIVTMLRLYEIVRNSAFRAVQTGEVAFVVEYHSNNIWLRNPNTNVLARSVSDRFRFMANHIYAYGFSRRFVDYFEEMMRRFDATFFEEQMLIIRYFETGSGMSTIYVNGVFVDEGNVLRVDVSVYIPDGYVSPNMGNPADRGNNFLIISLPRIENIYPIPVWNFIVS